MNYESETSQDPIERIFGATTPDAAYEIAPGMSVEEMRAEFFDADALLEAPERVYRLNSSGHRYYYKFDPETGEPQFFVSVTTMIKQTMPTSPFLIKWIADMGHDEAKAFAQERADYGTFMHTQIADLIINRSYDLSRVKPRLRDYIESQQLPSDFINNADDLKKDILAFAQFMIETNLKPFAIEPVLTHPTDGYAGAVDLVCELDIEEKGDNGECYKTGPRAGQPKETKIKRRVTAIIDFKSGRKGFFEEHEIQLKAYWEMWNAHYPSRPVDRIFNWSPKDWRGKTPTYNLKDQTNSPNLIKLPLLVQLARIEDQKRENTVVATSGVIDLNRSMDLTENIQQFTLSELVKKHQESEQTPEPGQVLTIDELAGERMSAEQTQGIIEYLNQQPSPETEGKEPEGGEIIINEIDF